jgi:hypothetical protein
MAAPALGKSISPSPVASTFRQRKTKLHRVTRLAGLIVFKMAKSPSAPPVHRQPGVNEAGPEM